MRSELSIPNRHPRSLFPPLWQISKIVRCINFIILSRIYTLYSKRKFKSRQDSYNNWNDTVYQSNLGDEVLISLRKIINNVETAENPKVDMWCHLGTSLIRAPGEGSVHFSLSLMNIKNPSCLKVVFFSAMLSLPCRPSRRFSFAFSVMFSLFCFPCALCISLLITQTWLTCHTSRDLQSGLFINTFKI